MSLYRYYIFLRIISITPYYFISTHLILKDNLLQIGKDKIIHQNNKNYEKCIELYFQVIDLAKTHKETKI